MNPAQIMMFLFIPYKFHANYMFLLISMVSHKQGINVPMNKRTNKTTNEQTNEWTLAPLKI